MIGMLVILIAGFIMMVSIVGMVSFWITRYKKVGPNELLVVYGRNMPDPVTGKRIGYRLVKGGGTFIWPVIENYKVFPVNLINLKLSDFDSYDKYNEPLVIDLEAQVSFENNDLSLGKAIENLLDKSFEEIEKIAREILECHVNYVCGEYSQEELLSLQRSVFAKQVEDCSSENFSSLGMKLALLNVNRIRAKNF